MELAVIIPTLDEGHSIKGCLDSVGAHDGVEVVVSDGGSGDNTIECARSAGAQVIEGRRGRGPQLNSGAAATRAPRLLFLHADCRLPEGWLPAVSSALADREVSLACFRLHTLSSKTENPSAVHRWLLRVFDLRSHGLWLPYGDQGFAVRREIFDLVGGFREIPLMEDVSFAESCQKHGKVKRLPLAIQTTARRVEYGPLRTMLMFVFFPTLFRLGVSPRTLASWYGSPR